MSREQVRAVIRLPFTEFVKNPDFSNEKTDAFDGILVHVYYDRSGCCDFVELGGGAARPIFRGKDLLAMPFAHALSWFRELDPNLKLDCGLQSDAFGIGLYAPLSNEEPTSPAEGASVFARGYYDQS